MKYSKESEDAHLIEGCKLQKRDAQRYLYEKHFKILMTKALRYASNDRESALDIVNQSFLKIFTKIEEFKGDNLAGWMHRILNNTAIDWIRTKKDWKLAEIDGEKHQHIIPFEFNNENLNESDLLNVIHQLKEPQKAIFILSMKGYKTREIGELVGINENTVKWHLATSKNILQNIVIKMKLA